MSSKKLIKTAFHEAGHAVAYHYFNSAFKKISIIPDGDSLGRVLHRKINRTIEISDRDNKTRNRVEKMVIIFLAGLIAEKKFSGRQNLKYAGYDLNAVIPLLSTQCQSTAEIEAYLGLLWIRTRQIFEYSLGKSNTPYWKCVEKLADTLIANKEINYKESKSIIDKTLFSQTSKQNHL